VAVAEGAVRDEEASELFSGLEGLRGLLIAVSGGSDSTALLLLAARWVARLKEQFGRAPKLIAVTIDHRLRPDSAREAAAVKRLARSLGVPHRTLRWRGRKPKTGLQEAARDARYRLLASTAVRAGYAHVLTAHTLDDQAETVLFRLARGSGLTGLAGMAPISPSPACGERSPAVAKRGSAVEEAFATRGRSASPSHPDPLVAGTRKAVFLVRPLLRIPKERLAATLRAAGIVHSEDPSNRDPRFARTRLRLLMPHLAREGLDARSLARFAARMRRAEAAIEFAVEAARAALTPGAWGADDRIVMEAARFRDLPAEVGLRLLGRAITYAGDEGPLELGKLELLYEQLSQSRSRIRRTLAGALVTLDRDRLTIERAPARRPPAARRTRNKWFTK
jgi:tRNA(Ile)-lysidine synthase